MNINVIKRFLRCPVCGANDLEPTPFESKGETIINGVVSCAKCERWYRIESEVLELVSDDLRSQEHDHSFKQRFSKHWTGIRDSDIATEAVDAHKWGQKKFFDSEQAQYETGMMSQNFWRSFDHNFLQYVREVAKGGLMVEIGGGTGRFSLPLRNDFQTILSFDLSENMVRSAIQARNAIQPMPIHVHYFVGDAENPPLQSSIADFCLLSGILHHIGEPEVALKEMARILKVGGGYMGNENNHSFFRPVFDILMHIKTLWKEEAHEHHFIISREELSKWLGDAGLNSSEWTSVFLPPHMFNLLSPTLSTRFMLWTDKGCSAVPWLRSQGGLLLYSGSKSGK
ncbi:methyltransferase domain-containing protein [Gammaproteobacteria bacterium]|nr:methyltransferase domain-containing protein [Gammaproteobacteria bacterium]